jgi:hypothetical protein
MLLSPCQNLLYDYARRCLHHHHVLQDDHLLLLSLIRLMSLLNSVHHTHFDHSKDAETH